jgi:RNA polymerase sigma-70 factor, ECF subfamily
VEQIASAILGDQPSPDLVHDICVEITLANQRFRHDCAYSTWMYAIVSHHVHNWMRRERKQRSLMHAVEQASLHVCASGLNESEDRFALVEGLRAALASLTETQRTCLFLLRCESRTSREVAVMLKTTPTAVRMHLHRARARLRRRLER